MQKIWLRSALALTLASSAVVTATSMSACSTSLPTDKKTTLGLDDAPEGKVVAKLTFTRSVTTTVPAGENVIVGDQGEGLVTIGCKDVDQDVIALPFRRICRAMPVR